MNLKTILKSIRQENISTAEIIYLQEHKKEVLSTGDPLLCQWAGITEQEYLNGKLK